VTTAYVSEARLAFAGGHPAACDRPGGAGAFRCWRCRWHRGRLRL